MAVVKEGEARWPRGYVKLDHSRVNPKKRAWGEDVQRVMQLMMGQLRSEDDHEHEHVTLDLLGEASSGELKCNNGLNWGFLELDPDQPLPCGWEKCLDLQTGKLSFLKKQTDVRTICDTWKQQSRVAIEPLLAREFLCCKQSEASCEEETQRLRTTSSSESAAGSSDTPTETKIFITTNQEQLLSNSTSASLEEVEEEAASSTLLALDLNLVGEGSGCSSSSRSQPGQSSVCTMEMVHNAMKRYHRRNHKFLSCKASKQSGSSSVSSLTSIQSERTSCCRQGSPCTRTSSSTCTALRPSSSLLRAHPIISSLSLDDSQSLRPASIHRAGAAESKIVGDGVGTLVMGACTRCLMYVMLDKSDPNCPRCESMVRLDFSTPPFKKQRTVVDQNSLGGMQSSSGTHEGAGRNYISGEVITVAKAQFG